MKLDHYRVIEGIQEFMLIVTRPANVEGLCVEAALDLGHFSEDVSPATPGVAYHRRVVTKRRGAMTVSNRLGERETRRIDGAITVIEVGADGYELDPRDGQGSVDEVILPDDDAGGTTGGGPGYPELPALEEYAFGIEPPNTLTISGMIRSEAIGTTTFHRDYLIHLRRPDLSSANPRTDVANLLITRRSLNVCFRSGEPCPQVIVPMGPVAPESGRGHEVSATATRESIVHERDIRMNPTLVARAAAHDSRAPAAAELLRQVHHALATSWRQPTRYPEGAVGFLDSDYFRNRLMTLMPEQRLNQPLSQVE